MNTTHTHKFELAGLGKAPFRFVRVTTKIGPIRTALPDGTVLEQGAPGQPMGSCKYCGQGIANCYEILSADGKRFDVGCDCVEKTGDAGLVRVVNREVTKQRREKANARAQALISEATALLAREDVRALLSSRPHSRAEKSPYFASMTELDEVEWLMKHAGRTGKSAAARFVIKTAGEIVVA